MGGVHRLRGLRQAGQAMVEYVIVVAFGVLLIVGIGAEDGPLSAVVGDAVDAVQSNYEGYSFAVSMSDYPDVDSSLEYRDLLEAQGIPEDRIDYLTDDPTDLVNDLVNEYVVANLPGLGEFDFSSLPLNPMDFLSPF